MIVDVDLYGGQGGWAPPLPTQLLRLPATKLI